jgi:hypothetical protein
MASDESARTEFKSTVSNAAAPVACFGADMREISVTASYKACYSECRIVTFALFL